MFYSFIYTWIWLLMSMLCRYTCNRGVILFAVTYNRIFYHSLVLVCPKDLGIHADCNRNSIQEHSSIWYVDVGSLLWYIIYFAEAFGARSINLFKTVFVGIQGEFGQKITLSTYSRTSLKGYSSSLLIHGHMWSAFSG